MQSMLHKMAQSKTTDSCGHAISISMNSQEPGSDNVDPDFGHDSSALHSNTYPGSYNIYSYTGVAESSITWMRLTDAMQSGSGFYQKDAKGKNISLYGDSIVPHDVQQGRLGDCYFLAAVAALAEDNGRFKEIFDDQSLGKKMYIWMYIRGLRKKIWLDDYLPDMPWGSYKELIYGRIADDGAAWGPVLEKAWAKINNNYELIIGGSQTEVFKVFTGAPMTEASVSSYTADQLWDILSSADGKNLVMGAGTPSGGNGGDSSQMENGVHYNHAYTILGVHDTPTKDGSTNYRLVHLRNPWDLEHYSGEFADNKAIWDTLNTDGMQVSTTNDDGRFWMTIEEFKTTFSFFNVNQIHSDWKSYVAEDTSGDTSVEKKYPFTLSENVEHMYAQLDFYHPRMLPSQCKDSYDVALFQLYKGSSRVTYQYTNAPYGHINIDVENLTPGDYEFRVKVTQWKSSTGREYTLRTFSKEGVSFNKPDGTAATEQYVLGANSAGSQTNSDNTSDDSSTSDSSSTSDDSSTSESSSSDTTSDSTPATSEPESESESEPASSGPSGTDDGLNSLLEQARAAGFAPSNNGYWNTARGWWTPDGGATYYYYYEVSEGSDAVNFTFNMKPSGAIEDKIGSSHPCTSTSTDGTPGFSCGPISMPAGSGAKGDYLVQYNWAGSLTTCYSYSYSWV